MLLHSLKLENFKQYRNTDIEFKDGITGIIGNNGAGKSTIVEAILFALFGLSGTGLEGDYITSSFAEPRDQAKVRLLFSIGGDDYMIVRTFRRRGTSTQHNVNFFKNKQAFATGVKGVLEAVKLVIGMGPTDFRNTIYAGQKDLQSLMENQPGKRKEWFMKVLGIDYLRDGSHAAVKARIGSCEAELGILSGKLQELDSEDETERLKTEQELLAAAEKSERELKVQEEELNLRKKALEEERKHLHDIQKEHLRLTGEVKTLSTISEQNKSRNEKLEGEIKTLENLKTECERFSGAEEQYRTLKLESEKIEQIKVGYDRLKNEQEKYRGKLSLLNNQQKKICDSLKRIQDDEAEIRELQPSAARWRALEEALENAGRLEPEYQKLTSELKKHETRMAEITKHAGGIRNKIKALEGIAGILEEKERAAKSLNELELLDARLTKAEGHAQNRSILNRQLVESEKKVSNLLIQINELTGRLKILSAVEENISALEAENVRFSVLISQFSAQKQALLQQKEKVRNNALEIKDAGREGRCPMCHQNLGDHYETLLGDLNSEINAIVLNLSEIDEKSAAIKDQQKENSTKREDFRSKNKLREELKNGLSALKSTEDSLHADIDKLSRQVEAESSALSELGITDYSPEKHAELKERLLEIRNIEKEAATLRGECAALPSLIKERKQLIEETEQILAEKQLQEEERAALGYDPDEKKRFELEKKTLENDVRRYHDASARCKDKERVEEEYRQINESVASLDEISARTGSELSALNFSPEKYAEIQERCKTAETECRHLHDLKIRTEPLPELICRLEEQKKAEQDNLSKISQTEEEIRKNGYEPATLRENEEQILRLAEQSEKLSLEISENQKTTATLRFSINASTERIKRAEKYLSEQKELATEVELLKLTRKMLNNYITYLLQVVKDQIEGETGRILSEITDGRYDSVLLDDNFNILIHDMGGDYPSGRFSGGEQDDIAIAMRIALSRYISEINEIHDSTFLIFDEIFGSQDEGRRNRLIQALRTQESHFPQIFLISHVTDVQGEFTNTLLVQQETDFSSNVGDISS